MKQSNHVITCISTQRAENVPKISKHFQGKDITFFVSKNEARSYTMYGATNVIECERNICDARNKAFLFAKEKGMYCVQTSDDLQRISAVVNGKKVVCTTDEAVNEIIEAMERTGSMIGGVSITDNILNYKKDWSYNKLVVNDLIVISPKNEILFDTGAFLKEDYDMFVMQMLKHGSVVRADKYLCSYPHRQNKHGANTYRTYDTEKKQNEYVLKKHPEFIQPHNRRENQISINYKSLYANILIPPN